MRDYGKAIATIRAAAGDQSRVIDFLSQPESYPCRPDPVERHETHGAIVFLAGSEAYKIKRAVRFPYMDFSTLEKRRCVIERELSINKPHAPAIYLDVVAITREPGGQLEIGGSGEPVEWALHMRRFDQSDLLSARADRSMLDSELCRQLADAVYAFHRKAAAVTDAGSAAQMQTIAHEIAEALAPAAPHVRPSAVERFRREAERQAASWWPLLDKRLRAGCVRRCHGDLHFGNIVLWQGSPVLFDAIEFDEKLATIDTLYDLAFLLMDLDHCGQRCSANAVLNRYLWRSQNPLDLEGLAVLPLFLALRAGVRAMVAAQRAAQEMDAKKEAGLAMSRSYLEAGLAHLELGPPRALAIGGLSGTGKSTLAAALAPQMGRAPGAVHLRSDLERKAIFGVAETELLPQSAYTLAVTNDVYRRLITKAESILRSGYSVVADAVYSRTGERAAIEAAARRCNVPFMGLWLEAPPAALHSRVEQRAGDASDATARVVAQQLSYELGHMDWIKVDASGNPETTLSNARARLTETHETP